MKSAISLLLCFAGILSPSLHADLPKPDEVPALQIAADQGDAAAKFQLARAYFRGLGVSKDEEKAALLLREAAAAGNVDAMESLGFLYTKGQGVPQDEAKAIEWFRKGAEAGSPGAQLNLGLMLRQGKSIELSNEESLKWIHQSADAGHPRAISVLGQLYWLGDKLLQPDLFKARPYLLLAAEAGDPNCQNLMGVICRDGIGIKAEYKGRDEAIGWFRKAAEQNDAKAQSNLAHLLGVESVASENRKEALVWLLIANDQGEITAIKTLKEIREHLPAPLLVQAEKEAKKFTLKHLAGAKKGQD